MPRASQHLGLKRAEKIQLVLISSGEVLIGQSLLICFEPSAIEGENSDERKIEEKPLSGFTVKGHSGVNEENHLGSTRSDRNPGTTKNNVPCLRRSAVSSIYPVTSVDEIHAVDDTMHTGVHTPSKQSPQLFGVLN